MEIYILRHAETDYNKKGIIQGSEVDSNINSTGILQSDKFYSKYKDIEFDKVFVSNLKRTYQTVKNFIEINNIPFEKLKEFNEISWGVNQGKNDDLKDYKKLIDTWLDGELDNKFERGESPNEMVIRLVEGFKYIISHNLERVLLCIHGRALRILLSEVLDKDLTKMDKYPHSNTGLYIMKYVDEENVRIMKSNLRDHLG
tara:strand:- start:2689 stop:3288 length:600 start_codon:yes stop_codon:yes gene_type:complete